jgi:hypothetical protein
MDPLYMDTRAPEVKTDFEAVSAPDDRVDNAASIPALSIRIQGQSRN